jgi:tRNA nucleotidyltransferase (CCA-adding enzyme)
MGDYLEFYIKINMILPSEVKNIIKVLNDAGFEAYAVGGCVRDFLLKREPYDWDVTTNAKPEQIQKIFPESVYENEFGTVGVKTESEDEKLSARGGSAFGGKVIEVTTYRIEEKYTDKRHPDEVKFTSKLEDDLARRDFTMNAIAYDLMVDKKILKIKSSAPSGNRTRDLMKTPCD